jgi:hypothetical protein
MGSGTQFDPLADYCTLFPDALFGVDYRYCCHLHDIAYGSLLNRNDADWDMYICILDQFPASQFILGLVIGTIMYMGVRLFGRTFYRMGKKNGSSESDE